MGRHAGAGNGGFDASRSGCCWPDEDVNDERHISNLGESEPLDVVEGSGVGAVTFLIHLLVSIRVQACSCRINNQEKLNGGKRTHVY